jgi:hypothetical protein
MKYSTALATVLRVIENLLRLFYPFHSCCKRNVEIAVYIAAVIG